MLKYENWNITFKLKYNIHSINSEIYQTIIKY